MLFTICMVVLSLAVAPVVFKLCSLMLFDFINYMDHLPATTLSRGQRKDLLNWAIVATVIAVVWSVTASLTSGWAWAVAGTLLGGTLPAAFILLVWSVTHICCDGPWFVRYRVYLAWEAIDRYYAEGKRRCKAKLFGSDN